MIYTRLFHISNVQDVQSVTRGHLSPPDIYHRPEVLCAQITQSYLHQSPYIVSLEVQEIKLRVS